MANAPPAALLRLREADVVRLCGFAAAARGLELADRHAVTGGARDDLTLRATVADEVECRVTVALPGESASGGLRWSCSAHAGVSPIDLGCVHVAALLTAWIRSPSDFPADDVPGSALSVTIPSAPMFSPPPRISQPALLTTTRPPRPRGSCLEDELAALPTAELLAIARRVVGADLSEHEARAALAQALADPVRVAALLARLDASPRRLFASIQLLGGATTATDLDAFAERSSLSPSAIRMELAVLARHGLVFHAPGTPAAHVVANSLSSGAAAVQHSWRELSGWRIPPEVLVAIPPQVPLDPLPVREPHGTPVQPGPDEAASTRPRALRVERASLRPLLLALTLLARAPAPLGPFAAEDANSAEGTARPRGAREGVGISPGRLAALAPAAGLDPVAAGLARCVLLLAAESAPGQPLTDLARVPPQARFAALLTGLRLWRHDTGDAAAELELGGELLGRGDSEPAVRLRVDTTHPAYRPGAIGEELAQARRFALKLLAAVSPGAWYALDELVALVWRLDPLFLRARQQAHEKPIWWLEARRGRDGIRQPLRPAVHDEWMAGEAVYLRQLFTGSLWAWGALDLACDPVGKPFAVRVTPFGRLALADQESCAVDVSEPARSVFAVEWGPAALPTRGDELAVQPLASGAELLDSLDRWARPSGVVGGRLIYALSRELACAAFDHGASPEELPRQLLAADGERGERAARLVTQRLAGWRAEYGQTCIREGWALMEAQDEPVLAEALALIPGLAARCHRLDATHALLAPDDMADLRPLLVRRGYPV